MTFTAFEIEYEARMQRWWEPVQARRQWNRQLDAILAEVKRREALRARASDNPLDGFRLWDNS